MCGIAGLVSTSPLVTDWKRQLRALEQSIRHRGPDDHGYFADSFRGETPVQFDRDHPVRTIPRVAFVHRRLSIIDLSEDARQPMVRANGRVFLTYNGEIYNFRELRRELRALGRQFRTRSDTEVVLEAYLQWGISFVSRLRGIFAFAIADLENRKVFLVRDHLGVKPLYLGRVGETWVFSSELKSFAQLPGFRPEIDMEAIRKYLHFLWLPGEHTGLRSVRKLQPGTWTEIDLDTGAQRAHTYWSPLIPGALADANTSIEELRDELRRSVHEQLVSDVQLGAFLSGGLDSSLIVALMREAGVASPMTYSIGYSKADLAYDIVTDDLPYAREVSEIFNTKRHEFELAPNVAELLPRVVEALDEPLGDPAAISSYLICQEAKRDVTVMLSGAGADELFGGYPRQRALVLAHAYRRMPAWVRHASERMIQRLPGAGKGPLMRLGRAGKKFVRDIDAEPLTHYIAMETYFSHSMQSLLLDRDGALAAAVDPVPAETAALIRRINVACPNDPLKQSVLWDLMTYLPNLNLAYTDRTSMAHGIETRVPFLDVRLVEWALRLRSKELIGWHAGRLHGKVTLKRAASPFLPKRIIWRKKAGFGAPVRSWLRNDLHEMRGELLASLTRERGWFDRQAVTTLERDFLEGREDYSLQLWMLMSLELWARAVENAGRHNTA